MPDDFDVMLMTAEEFSQLEDWQLDMALQQFTGNMAVQNAIMRENAGQHYKYLGAKEQFGHLKVMASTIQTLKRTKI